MRTRQLRQVVKGVVRCSLGLLERDAEQFFTVTQVEFAVGVRGIAPREATNLRAADFLECSGVGSK